jgi:hypothetical protein
VHPRWFVDPACQPLPSSLTSRPRTPPWTRPRHTFLGHLRMHPASSLSCAPSRTVSPPLLLCAHPGSFAAARLGLAPVLCSLRALTTPVASVSSALSSAAQDTPRFAPNPLVRQVRAHRSSPRAVEAPPPSTRGVPPSSPLTRCSSVSSRGEQPACAPISLFTALVFA